MTAMVETNPDYSRQMYEPQYNSHRPPDPPVVTSGLVSESDIRHQERQERLKYELSKEYHDHMQKKEEAARQRREEIMRRQSPTRQPPQSDMYDHNQMSQHLREERRREYNDFLQHQEQILNRAQNQVDMPVLDRRNQSPVRDAYNSPSVPPLGLDRRPPSGRWDPESYRQTNYAPVKQGEGPPSRGRQASRGRISSRENQDSINQPPFLQDRPSSQDRGYVPTMKPSSRELYRPQDRSDYNPDYNPDPSVRLSSPPHQANIGADDYSEYRRKVERDSRNSEYNQFLARKQVEDDARKQKMNEVRRQPAAPVVKGDYYDSESYDLKRQYLMEEKHKEYQNYLKKKQGDLQPRKPYNPNGPENRIGFMANLGTSLDRQRESLAHQRHEEYNNFLKDDSWYKPSIQRNDDRTSKPRDERPDDRPGSQRRSGTNQSYEDMLQAKRRQEANYRREDYHDYSRPGDRY